MGKKSGPPAPDYTAAAKAQGDASMANTQLQTEVNRPDIITPWGNQTWSEGTDNKWTQTTTLSPEEQQALDSQQRIQQGRSEGAETLLGQAVGNFQNPMDWNNLPDRSGNVEAGDLKAFSFGGSGDYRQRAQDAVWQLQKPMLDQERGALESQLANQGLARGSEAWNNEMRRMDDKTARAQLQAIDSGRAESNQAFGQDLSAGQFNNNTVLQELQAAIQAGGFNNTNRQGAVGEQTLQRGQTLNELNALLTGQQVNMPTMPTYNAAGKAETPNLLGAAQNQYDASLDAYNARQAGIGSLVGGLSSAAMMFSDARLKEDIHYTGASIGGVPVVHYRYRGLPGRRIGVIAQDALRIRPSAVSMHASGYLMVDYSELCS